MRKMKRIVILMILLVCSSLVSASLTNRWALDDGSGTTAADSVGTNDGTLINMENSDWVSGKIGSHALEFDGTIEYVDIGLGSDYNSTEGSVSVWIKPEEQTAIILSDRSTTGEYMQLYWFDSGSKGIVVARVASGANEINSATLASFGSWHHVILTWGSNGMQLYLNGTNVGSDPYTGSWTSNSNMDIGRAQSSHGVTNFNGIIDEVRFYDHQLNASEIAEVYNFYEQGVIPEVSSRALQIFVVLMLALLIGALFLRKK